jgi:hypothetical protein
VRPGAPVTAQAVPMLASTAPVNDKGAQLAMAGSK